MNATSTSPFSIRQAEPAEAENVLPCFEWLFAPPGSHPPGWRAADALGRLRNTLEAEDSAVFVASSADFDTTAGSGPEELIGFCSVYIDIESVRYGLRGWIEDLAVSPTSRSGGIGAALLRASRAWAKEHGATHLELDSGIRRKDAHRFYERQQPAWTGMQYAWQL